VTGIRVNMHPANVGLTAKGLPIFFEIYYIDVPKLSEFIMNMSSKGKSSRLRKNQAVALLKAIEEESSGIGRIYPHLDPVHLDPIRQTADTTHRE